MYVPVVLPVLQHVVHSRVVSEEEKEVHAQGAGDSQGIFVKDYHRASFWHTPINVWERVWGISELAWEREHARIVDHVTFPIAIATRKRLALDDFGLAALQVTDPRREGREFASDGEAPILPISSANCVHATSL